MQTASNVRTFQFPGMIARVYSPDLTPEEREKRMKEIHKKAAALLADNQKRKEAV